MAQLINITSEALQATIRRLLPSQQGFGEDLQASNVITPIIDLTPTAEGSEVRADLQTAIAFGSQTSTNLVNSSSTIISTTGFFRIFGHSSVQSNNAGNEACEITVTDGLSTKKVYEHQILANSTNFCTQQNFDFVVFVAAGESVAAASSDASCVISITTRQIATVTGELVNPSGFVIQ
jgi:hypothetical protein